MNNIEKLPVRVGCLNEVLPGAMLTREQVRAYGDRNMPNDLKRAGFKTFVFRSDREIHGADYFRFSYGK